MTKTRVLVVDDQLVARRGLRVLLSTWPDLEVVGEAANAEEAICLTDRLCPDVVLMDIRMPDSSTGSGRDTGGLLATKRIKERWPAVRVIVLTMYGTFQKAASEAQADAFLLKGGSAEALIGTIRRLQGTELYDSGAIQCGAC